jgi:beta-glucanase (GH16 family)
VIHARSLVRGVLIPLAVATVVVFVALAAQGATRGKILPHPITPRGPITSQYTMVWHDEFSGTTLDSSKWSAMNNSTFGDGSNQLACLEAANVSEGGGILKLTAEHVATPVICGNHDSRFPSGRSYTSAFVQTLGKASFKYGKIELRAKLPIADGSSQGLWPAFWLRPVDSSVGELDVFEAVGSGQGQVDSSPTVSETIHYDYVHTYPQEHSLYTLSTGDFASQYHVFAVIWTPTSITWTIDGHAVYVRDTKTTSWLAKTFSRQYYLRLNVAVGGNGVGAPTAATTLPASLDVDWVRVYQLHGSSTGPTPTPTPGR